MILLMPQACESESFSSVSCLEYSLGRNGHTGNNIVDDLSGGILADAQRVLQNHTVLKNRVSGALDIVGQDVVATCNGSVALGSLHQREGTAGADAQHHARIIAGLFNNGGDKDTYIRTTKARDILTHQDDVLHGEEIFEKLLLKLKDFPLLAVVDRKGDFLGVVTRFDVLEQFQSAFGMQKKGIRIAFTSVETEGRLARLSEIAHQYHEHIISFVTFDETDELVRRMVMKIEPASNLDKFTKKMEAAGFRILSITED